MNNKAIKYNYIKKKLDLKTIKYNVQKLNEKCFQELG